MHPSASLNLFYLLVCACLKGQFFACRALRFGLGSLTAIALLYPFCTIIARHSMPLAYVFLVTVTCLRNISATFAFTSSMVMLNVAAPREHIGAPVHKFPFFQLSACILHAGLHSQL